MSLSWVNDRVGGPCQPGAWTRALPNLQFTPSGPWGRGELRKDDADDRRNKAVTQMSTKTKAGKRKCNKTDLTTEIGAVLMTPIFARAESAPSRTWLFTSSVNLSDSHTFLIQATLTNPTTANTRLSNVQNSSPRLNRQAWFACFLSEYVLNLKSVWLWCESGDASALCWRPKTELSNAANCLNPQKVFTWASTVCGFLVIQGHRGHAGTFPSALSDK